MRYSRPLWAFLALSLCTSPLTQSPTIAQESKPAAIQLKDLDGHFPFQVPESLDAWKPRSEQVQKQLLLSQGLWPKPNMAKPQPVIHSKRTLDGYSISKVYFESLPGLYVTGSLFQPIETAGKAEKHPAVLYAHGHWDHGRFYWANDAEVNGLLATGAERFTSAARNHLQACCVQLARMGCVVFQYDMIGYADSQQISFDRGHRFGLAGPNPETPAGDWLLYSPTAEGHMQSTMALQTINTLQAFEFLSQRPDVDASRIAITGASGGGTQSFIAAAVEPRIAAAFPAVMVSTSMQGGCTCENACNLRVGTGNIEVAALIAPRPLGMTAADDWTRNMAKEGFPELQKIYELFGVKDRVKLFAATHFPHNYNHVARVGLYGFINRHFGLGLNEPVLEHDFEVLRRDELTVWDKDHPAPSSGPSFEASLLKNWAADVDATIKKSPELAKQGWDILLEPANTIAKTLTVRKAKSENGDQRIEVVNSAGGVVGELTIPKAANGKTKAIQLVAKQDENSSTTNSSLLIRDAYGFEDSAQQAVVKNPRPAASYTYGYNAPQAIRKLAVLVRVVDELAADSKGAGATSVQGEGELGFMAQAAKQLRPTLVEVPANNGTFDFTTVDTIRHPMFVPGALRFGSLK